MEEDLCTGVIYLTVLCGHIPSLFPTLWCSAIPTSCYIFNVFLILYILLRLGCGWIRN